MKSRLYLFLSSLVSVLRIITFLLRIIPFQSLKLAKFRSRRSVGLQRVLVTTPNKENTCSSFVPSGRELKKTKKQKLFSKKVQKLDFWSWFDDVCRFKTNCVKRIDGCCYSLLRQQLHSHRLQLHTCTQSRSRSPAWQMSHTLLSASAKWLGKWPNFTL